MSTSRTSLRPRTAPLPRPAPGPRVPRGLALLATVLLGGSALTACAGGSAAEPDADGPAIVASTTVYADVARQVAGDHATVEAVIADTGADPHSYEPTAADAARVATADLVVYNGGGYDPFVDLALANAGDVPVVRGVDEYAEVTGDVIPEHSHDHGPDEDHGANEHDGSDGHHDADEASANEHVWFSLPTMAAVASQLAEELAVLDPANAGEYRANAEAFGESLSPLGAQLDQIHDRGHFPYAQTERIGAHLFDSAHLVDETPRGFLASVEDDSDPSAADLATLLALLEDRQVAFLAYNPQTETAVTTRVRAAAEGAGVVVVDITETLPEGVDYVTWVGGIVDSVTVALADATPETDGDH